MSQMKVIHICIDNKSKQALVKDMIFHDGNKHITMRYHLIRESIVERKWSLRVSKSKIKLQISFTKSQSLKNFKD